MADNYEIYNSILNDTGALIVILILLFMLDVWTLQKVNLISDIVIFFKDELKKLARNQRRLFNVAKIFNEKLSERDKVIEGMKEHIRLLELEVKRLKNE